MAVTWTEEQQKVISLRNRNILVSAAAGSGKTAVLVQRILSKILDKEHPVDIDRLLIMTFTRAAAGEMKERISAALEQALFEEPDNEHLQRQMTLIHTAPVSYTHLSDGFIRSCTRSGQRSRKAFWSFWKHLLQAWIIFWKSLEAIWINMRNRCFRNCTAGI